MWCRQCLCGGRPAFARRLGGHSRHFARSRPRQTQFQGVLNGFDELLHDQRLRMSLSSLLQVGFTPGVIVYFLRWAAWTTCAGTSILSATLPSTSCCGSILLTTLYGVDVNHGEKDMRNGCYQTLLLTFFSPIVAYPYVSTKLR
jgi:hypothetical protein